MLPSYMRIIADDELLLYKVKDVVVSIGKRDNPQDKDRWESICLLDLKYRVLRADEDIERGNSMNTPAEATSYMNYVIAESGSGESFKEKTEYILSCHMLWSVLDKEEVDDLLRNFREEGVTLSNSEFTTNVEI